MITQEQAKSLIDVAIKHGVRKKVDGIEATVHASNVSTSRFANNGMTQNQSPERITLSVRVQKGGKQARLSSDKISPAGIRELVENAITAASFLEKDEEMLPMLKGEKRAGIKNVNRYDARTANFSPDQRAKAIADMVQVAQQQNLTAAGIFLTGTWVEAIGNSEGLFRYHRETSAEVSVTMKHVAADGSESTGWAKLASPKVADIDAAALATRAAQKAVASANPAELPPGKYTVILEPPAVLDLMAFMWYDFAGTSHLDKLSCFLDKVGKKLLGDNITVVDDPFHPLQSGAPFDGEGMQRQVKTLVDKGVVANLVFGRRSARKMSAEPTGHGLAEPSAEGEYPMNTVLAGGDVSLDEMIRSTERGVLLTRVWYVREVDPTTKIVTGMTRDGTFLIEGGAIKSGIKNFRFNQSLLDMLNHVEALGPAERTAGEEGIPAVAPAMKVNNFNFASVTRF
jgi:predicted Zn-dependent protease